MNSLVLIIAALCVFTLGYRFYALFIARKVLRIDPRMATPAVVHADGHDYYKTSRYTLFGHHFAAIAGGGPLMGPVLAAQFGYLPGALWILFGAVLAGGVHDMVVLFASVRHQGRSLAQIVDHELGPTAGIAASAAVLFILVLTLAGFSIAVVNALWGSPWGAFMVFSTMPIAVIMGIYTFKIREGDVLGATLIGLALLFLAILAGPHVAAHPFWKRMFTLSKNEICGFLSIYGFAASVLPVWILLCPRDYLSSYLKVGTIALLAICLIYLHPSMQMPHLTKFIHGGGPVIPGSVIPFVFITIACGALSGFHSTIASGTTPKMIASENDIPFIGYGAMVLEGFVAIVALISACLLAPGDYFAINATPAVFASLGLTTVDLPALSAAVGENLAGRTGGAVSLAVGMAHVLTGIPFMKHMLSYWYHYAIMFEALFILTALDTGTRAGRFLLQEMAGRIRPEPGKRRSVARMLLAGLVFTSFWSYLVVTGEISTIWPIFGMSNQLLAATALTLGTVIILKTGKSLYAFITAVPGLLMFGITLWAGTLNVTTNYLPHKNYVLTILSLVLMALAGFIFFAAVRKGIAIIQAKTGQPAG